MKQIIHCEVFIDMNIFTRTMAVIYNKLLNTFQFLPFQSLSLHFETSIQTIITNI